MITHTIWFSWIQGGQNSPSPSLLTRGKWIMWPPVKNMLETGSHVFQGTYMLFGSASLKEILYFLFNARCLKEFKTNMI